MSEIHLSVTNDDGAVATPTSRNAYSYALSLAAGDVVVRITFEGDSDYYDVQRVVALMNELFDAMGAAPRVHAITTGDQTALLRCAAPRVARALGKEFGLSFARPRKDRSRG